MFLPIEVELEHDPVGGVDLFASGARQRAGTSHFVGPWQTIA